MLVTVSRNDQLRRTFPHVEFSAFIVKTDLPSVGARANRQHGKAVRQDVRAHAQLHVVGGTRPDQLAILIEQRDTVMASANRLANFHSEVYAGRAESVQDVRILAAALLNNFPFHEAALGGDAGKLRSLGFTASHGGFVGGGDFVGVAVEADLAVVDPDDAVTETPDLIELMGDEDDGAALASNLAHFAEAFFLEVYIAHRQDLINEENFWFEVGGDGKGQADVHAGGVVLDGSVDKFFEFGEGDDFVEFAGDVAFAHAEDGAGEEGVFAAGQLGVEAGADFEKAADAAVDFGEAGRGLRDAREDFEQGGFTGAVAADEAEDFAFANVKGDLFEGPEGFVFLAAEGLQRRADKFFQGVAEAGAYGEVAAIIFAEGFGVDDGGHGCALTMDNDLPEDAGKRRDGKKDPPLETKGGAPKTDRLDAVGNGALHLVEEEQAAREDDQDGENAGGELRAGGLRVAGEGPAETVNDAGHGIEAVEPAETLRDQRAGINDGRGEHPELHEKGDDVADVAVEGVEGGGPQADAKSGEQREEQEGGEPDDVEAGANAVGEDDDEHHSEADGEVHEAGENGRDGEDEAGEIHFGDDALIVDDDVGAILQGGGEIGPGNESGEIKNGIGEAVGGELGEAAEK